MAQSQRGRLTKGVARSREHLSSRHVGDSQPGVSQTRRPARPSPERVYVSRVAERGRLTKGVARSREYLSSRHVGESQPGVSQTRSARSGEAGAQQKAMQGMQRNVSESLGAASDVYNRLSRDGMELFSRSMDLMNRVGRIMGMSPIMGSQRADETFDRLQKSVTAVPEAAGEMMNFSRRWYEGFTRMYQSWFEEVQKLGSASRSAIEEGGQPEPVIDSLNDSMDRFMMEMTDLFREQTRSLSDLLKRQLSSAPA